MRVKKVKQLIKDTQLADSAPGIWTCIVLIIVANFPKVGRMVGP
jgi:hypothetical protein